MYLTARQLEAQLREASHHADAATGSRREIVLPWGTRLTPAAFDLVRERRLEIRFADRSVISAAPSGYRPNTESSRAFRWWCCPKIGAGAIRAALVMAGRQHDLRPMTILDDPSSVSSAIRTMSHAVEQQQWAGGILVVEHAARATIECNRHPALRASVVTSIAGLDVAMHEAAINVMILEINAHPLMTVSNLLSRFTSGVRGDIPSWATPNRSCGCVKGGV